MDQIDIEFPGIQKAIITDVFAGHPLIKNLNLNEDKIPCSYRAIWDTGSTNTLITQKVIEQLDLKPIGRSEVFGITGASIENTYLVSIKLLPYFLFESIRVIGCNTLGRNVDVLIGMDIINKGDLALTNANGKTRFYFQYPSQGAMQL